MPPLPILSGKQLIKALKKCGYIEVRRKGSHIFIRHESGDTMTVIPVHGKEDLGKGILKSILNDLEMTVEDLLEVLKK